MTESLTEFWPAAVAKLPAPLQCEAQQALERILEVCDTDQRRQYQHLAASAEDAHRLATLLAASPFAAQLCRRHPEWLPALRAAGDLDRAVPAEQWPSRARAALGEPESVAALDEALRRWRNREQLRLIWRDFNRLADMAGTTAEVSALADQCIQCALDYHYAQLCQEWGVPMGGASGEPQQLVVLGMGKLGAGELNLSSDIDLIFAYPEGGTTVGGPTSVSNQEFFVRLGQRLIKTIDQPTIDGIVFRVDMRLRPYGDSGALVLSFDAMEEYYQDQGRDWERYAMIKARAVAGDAAAGADLLALLRPFTYRRYVDYSAFESLRDMKAKIQREVQRRRLHDNIKLGPGGIREVEFIAQCFQLIRGGREPALQERRLQPVLTTLGELGYLPATAVAELQAAYEFLRNAEHGIQGYQDKQSQELPTTELPRAALARVMGFVDWPAFKAELDAHRDRVGAHFMDIIALPQEERSAARDSALAGWRSLWLDEELDAAALTQRLAAAGHELPDEAARRLLELRAGTLVRRMQSLGRERLDQFMPQLLAAVTAAEHPSQTLLRILPLVEAVLRRTAYLVLLVENPVALQQLVVLCSASPWISEQLARHPVLLDELLDSTALYQVPAKQELQSDLRQQLLRLSWDDLEAQMEALRYFKLAHVLRVAAAEVTGRLPLMKVSDYLTWIAETILEHVLELAWRHLTDKYGRPQREPGVPCDKDFIIVGYGKLGGIELGHGSDLDLVFIHDGHPALGTDGETSIDNSVFFTRLGQRLIHILTTQTPLGALYEVDMRLRPSGNSGLLVSSLKSFTEYQQNSAWTWEHQALVRARPVAGDNNLAAAFERVRHEVLSKPRDLDKLRQEVGDMRQKMREQLRPKDTETEANPVFDLKQGTGGIVDIEFMVQFAALAWSHRHAELTRFTDNIRILESLQLVGLLEPAVVEGLIESYKTLRSELHRLGLQGQPGRAPIEEFARQRELVLGAWHSLLG